MAVIFGVGAVLVGALVVYDNVSDHSDYSDYSDYDNYDNYSDAAERRQRRIESLKSDTECAANDLSAYKKTTINPELKSKKLKEEPAMAVSEAEMDRDVGNSIKEAREREIHTETAERRRELEKIEILLDKISKIQEGE